MEDQEQCSSIGYRRQRKTTSVMIKTLIGTIRQIKLASLMMFMSQGPDDELQHNGRLYSSNWVTFSAIKHSAINFTVHDPPPQHARILHQSKSLHHASCWHLTSLFQGADQVLLAQLRSDHCHKLAAYHNVIDPTADPVCRRCSLASHTLEEHWLQECPATASQRFQILGEVDPHLSGHQSARVDPVGAGKSPVTRGRRTHSQQQQD